MKWIINTKKGTTINHPHVGRLEGLVAYEVEDRVANQLKNIINILVFDKIVPKKVVEKDDKGENT